MREVERFGVVSDDGEQHVVVHMKEIISAGSMDGPATMDGLSNFFTDRGETLNKLDNDTFKVVVSGKILRRA